ncbi:hypothetical protein BH23BAC1_BH23BAC1_17110 [soil metagenome]
MSSLLRCTYALLLGVALYSCAPPMYKPNAINAPQLFKKQDLKVAANINVIVPGLDFQSAYAVTESIGLMANPQEKN